MSFTVITDGYEWISTVASVFWIFPPKAMYLKMVLDTFENFEIFFEYILDTFGYFWILLDTCKISSWYLNFYVFKKDSYQTEDPPYLSLIGTQGNLRNAQLSPFVTTKTGPIGIHWKGTRIKKELLKGSLLTYLTFGSSIFSLQSKQNPDTLWIHSILIVMRLSLTSTYLYWRNTFIRYYLVLVVTNQKP